MEIRLVMPDEYDALGVLTVEAFEAIDGAHDLGAYADELCNVADRAERAEVLVAIGADGLLGGVTFVPDAANPYAEDLRAGEAGIRMLAVSRGAQGRGVGRALTEACMAQAGAVGARRIALHSTPWMVVAHRLYQSLGFVRTPGRDVDISPDLRLMSFVLDLD